MKRFFKWLLKPVSFALIICLVIAFLPHISALVQSLFKTGDPIVTTTLLKSKMQEVGKLTVLEYSDEHILDARKSALFFDAQTVTFPYEYCVALGIDLQKVALVVNENKLIFRLPPIDILYDELTVTGEIVKWDLFLPFTEQDYQNLLENEKLKCKTAYLLNQDVMDKAFSQTVATMKTLFGKWLTDANLSLGNLEMVFETTS